MKTWRSKIACTTAFLVPVALAAAASQEYGYWMNTWQNQYPTSASLTNCANVSPGGSAPGACNLCHAESYDHWNRFGWQLVLEMQGGASLSEALVAVELVDSDNDPNGITNLDEILADTQPGWTPGPNNRIYARGGDITENQLPPAGFLGDLDPLACGNAAAYCTAGTSASGCAALLSAVGTPSATALSGFVVSATGVEGAKDGQFYFGTSGRQSTPWGNGSSYRCVSSPVVRAGLLSGNGTSGKCDGSLAQDLNTRWVVTRPVSNPGVGATVYLQLWYRDPQNPSNQTTSFSDALEFTVCP